MPRDLTPRVRTLFLTIALAACSGALQAQDSQNPPNQTDPFADLGPGSLAISTLNPGLVGIGTRSGKPVDLRLYGGITGVYDTDLQPLSVDAKGNLINLGALYGVEVSVGAYGTHIGKRYGLSVDFRGNARHYTNNAHYDGSDGALSLGYRYQVSRRVMFNLSEMAGTYTSGTGSVATLVNDGSGPAGSGPQLFDTRMNYFRSGADVTFVASNRMYYQISATGYYQAFQDSRLGKSFGYSAAGSATRRLSKNMSAGASYSYNHSKFPSSSSVSDTHTIQGTFSTIFAEHWTASLSAGVSVSEIVSPVVIPLSPELAALFGTPSITALAYKKSWYPTGSIELKRAFRHSEWRASYSRSITPGGSVFYTSRTEGGSIGWSYSGARKWNFGTSGNYWNSSVLSQGSQKYVIYSVGAGFTYSLFKATYLNTRYDFRRQDYSAFGGARDGSRVTIGLSFSPGSIPLSLW